VITTQFDHFVVNGHPKFLVFVSYFDATRASNATLDSDFQYIRNKQIDGIRIFPNWLDWGTPPVPASDTLMDNDGNLRPARLRRLKEVLIKAKQYGLLVDISFTCDTVPGMTFNEYRSAMIAATNELSGDGYRHTFFDLQNERMILSCGGLGVPMPASEINDLRAAVENADPMRLVTASDGPSESSSVALAHNTQQDIIAFHDLRTSTWYSDTGTVVANFAHP